jgi:hypothetical protein
MNTPISIASTTYTLGGLLIANCAEWRREKINGTARVAAHRTAVSDKEAHSNFNDAEDATPY